MGEGDEDGLARDGVQMAADGVVCGNRRRKRHFRWGGGVWKGAVVRVSVQRPGDQGEPTGLGPGQVRACSS